MLRILFLLAVIVAMYYFSIWPFKKNVASISYLETRYCDNQNEEKLRICECIVERLKSDLGSRFTQAERDSMESDRLKMAYVLEKSLQQIETEAKTCLKNYDQPQAWDVFRADLASLDNEYLRKAGSAINSGADYLMEKWNSRKDEKREIDGRY